VRHVTPTSTRVEAIEQEFQRSTRVAHGISLEQVDPDSHESADQVEVTNPRTLFEKLNEHFVDLLGCVVPALSIKVPLDVELGPRDPDESRIKRGQHDLLFERLDGPADMNSGSIECPGHRAVKAQVGP